MAEWFKASVLKTDVGATLPRVRIPPFPKNLAPLWGLIFRKVGSDINCFMPRRDLKPGALLFYTCMFYNETMYIKIKNPARHALLVQLATLLLLLGIILAAVVAFTLVAGSITAVWEGAVEFFNYIKQEEGIFTAGFCVFGILMIPIGIIAVLVEWWQKRIQWNTPTAVFALDFGPEWVTVYTCQNTQFLPYKETDFKITAELVTVRTKYGSHAALHALTLTFLSQGHRIEVGHKLTAGKLLYQLADFHSRFKSFAFDCSPSSYDADQQELAIFLKEQIQNQTCYGLHRYYRSYLTLILYGLLFLAFGIGILCLVFSFGFGDSFSTIMGGMFLLLAIIFLTSSIILLYNVIKDKQTAHKIKQLRGN